MTAIFQIVTTVLLFVSFLPNAFSLVPPPDNVTVQCHNFVDVVYWNYSEPSLQPRFSVNVHLYSNPQTFVSCHNTTEHSCDVSAYTRNVEDSYFLRVKAIVGSNESTHVHSEEFTYSKYFHQDLTCLLDFPPVNLSVEPQWIVLEFDHPFLVYKRHLKKEPNKEIYKTFTYNVRTENTTEEYTFSCHASERVCKAKILILSQTERHCVTLEGLMGSILVEAAGEFCQSLQAAPSEAKPLILILGGVCALIVIMVLLTIGANIYKKMTTGSSTSLPKFLVSVITKREPGRRIIHDDCDDVSVVQTPVSFTRLSVCSVEEEEEKMDWPKTSTSSESLRFHIGAANLPDCSSGLVPEDGLDVPREDDNSPGTDFTSGYDRPKLLLVEMGTGDMVEAYKN